MTTEQIANEIANDMLGNKLFMSLLMERASRGEEITPATIVAAFAEEKAVIVRNLERISETDHKGYKSEKAQIIRYEIAELVYAEVGRR
jgi:hypothetical protein